MSYNQVLLLDLSYLTSETRLLHVTCTFLRYSVCVMVKDKCANTVIEAFLKSWISIFGAPRSGVLTDNGKEFNNLQFRDLCEELDLTMLTKADYCPFSNGICERGNPIVNIFHKLRLKFPKFLVQTILSYACMANNNLYNHLRLHTFPDRHGKKP